MTCTPERKRELQERLAEMIDVMIAARDGRKIQQKPYWTHKETPWYDVETPNWNWHDFNYRVRPEPIELDFWITPEGKYAGFGCAHIEGATLRKFREVIGS